MKKRILAMLTATMMVLDWQPAGLPIQRTEPEIHQQPAVVRAEI